MPKNQAQPEVTKVTFGAILSWLLGCLFTLLGALMIWGSFWGGLFILLGGLSLLPLTNRLLTKWFQFELSTDARILLFIGLVVVGIIVLGYSVDTDTQNDNQIDITPNENNSSSPFQDTSPFFICSSDPACAEMVSKRKEGNMSFKELEETIVWITYEWEEKDESGLFYSKGKASGSGIIFQQDPRRLFVFTNRHVIDCDFLDSDCYQRVQEDVNVRTSDGRIHPVTRVLFEPHNLDIVVLEVNASHAYLYKAAITQRESHFGDKVIAIGYPTALLEGGYFELSVKWGNILKKRTVFNSEGFSFEVIDSDAYINAGSSGGGLFLQDTGQLIGITTWGNRIETAAISLSSIWNIGNYKYCPKGKYFNDNKCLPYCAENETLKEGKCEVL